MEGSSTLIIALIVLAAGGATGAALMVDGGLMADTDAEGVQLVEALPYGDVDGSCSLDRAVGDCGTGAEGCSTPTDTAPSSGGCCC